MPIYRKAREADYDAIAHALQTWWTLEGLDTEAAARERAALVPRLWLQHFASTSFAVEVHGRLVAFLVGFLSQDRADEAYVHFVGVAPDSRRAGIARELYARFFDVCRAAGRRRVRCVTSPGNTTSLDFHRALGFRVEGTKPKLDYDGPGVARVPLVLDLE